MVSSAYLRFWHFSQQSWFQFAIHPFWHFTCQMYTCQYIQIYSEYKLNKQSNNIQACLSAFPILNQSFVPCPVLTVASCPAHRFFRRQVRWYGIPISWIISHSLLNYTVKGFFEINEGKVDTFLEFPCFLCDPINFDNLLSGSSAFSKSSLYIQKFLVHCWSRAWSVLSLTLLIC